MFAPLVLSSKLNINARKPSANKQGLDEVFLFQLATLALNMKDAPAAHNLVSVITLGLSHSL